MDTVPVIVDYPRKRKSNNPAGRKPVTHTHCVDCTKLLETEEDKLSAYRRGGKCAVCYREYHRKHYKATSPRGPQQRVPKLRRSKDFETDEQVEALFAALETQVGQFECDWR